MLLFYTVLLFWFSSINLIDQFVAQELMLIQHNMIKHDKVAAQKPVSRVSVEADLNAGAEDLAALERSRESDRAVRKPIHRISTSNTKFGRLSRERQRKLHVIMTRET